MYDLIESYLDNTLPETKRREIEQRMAADDRFRREVELYREMQSRYSDPGRLRLRATLAGIVKEPAGRKTKTKIAYMKQLYHYYVRALGERPALVLAFLLFVSGLLFYNLVCFVLKPSRGIFTLTPEMSAALIGGLIVLVCCVLLWRLTAADYKLRSMVLDKYREAIRLVDSKAKTSIRDLAGRLGIGKNLYGKLLRIIMLTPDSFIVLVLFLAIENILLFVASNHFPKVPPGSVLEDIYVNTPWAFAMFTFLYVIYNDIRVVENLRRLVDSIPVTKFADFFAHLEKFKEKLTRTEANMLDDLILYQHLSDKEIAHLTKAGSADVIKTHRFNILKKWGQYASDNAIDIPLEKLLSAFYFDSPHVRILPDDLEWGNLN